MFQIHFEEHALFRLATTVRIARQDQKEVTGIVLGLFNSEENILSIDHIYALPMEPGYASHVYEDEMFKKLLKNFQTNGKSLVGHFRSRQAQEAETIDGNEFVMPAEKSFMLLIQPSLRLPPFVHVYCSDHRAHPELLSVFMLPGVSAVNEKAENAAIGRPHKYVIVGTQPELATSRKPKRDLNAQSGAYWSRLIGEIPAAMIAGILFGSSIIMWLSFKSSRPAEIITTRASIESIAAPRAEPLRESRPISTPALSGIDSKQLQPPLRRPAITPPSNAIDRAVRQLAHAPSPTPAIPVRQILPAAPQLLVPPPLVSQQNTIALPSSLVQTPVLPAAAIQFTAPVPIRRVRPAVSLVTRGLLQEDIMLEVQVKVDSTGHVSDSKIADQNRPGARLLAQQTIQAAELWQFEPAKLNGKAVASETTLKFYFSKLSR